METNPVPKPPDGKKPLNWPIVVNLGILVLIFILSGGELSLLPGAVVGLAVVNGMAAVIMNIFGNLKWVFAFLLSALLILLIGLGICGLMLSGLGNMH